MFGRELDALISASTLVRRTLADKVMNDPTAFRLFSVLLDNKSMQAIACTCTHLSELQVQLRKEQLWWFRRTEHLLGRSLECAPADWKDVYANLLLSRTQFIPEHNYTNLTLIKLLLENGAGEQYRGMFIDHLAEKASRTVLEYIFSANTGLSTETNQGYNRALEAACFLENRVMLEMLLARPEVHPGNCDENGPLCTAINNGDLRSLQMLLAHPRLNRSNIEEALDHAGKYEYTEIVICLLSMPEVDNSMRDLALQTAAKNGDAQIVAYLLADGRADPAKGSSRALERAIEEGHAEVVDLLLKDGRSNPGLVLEAFEAAVKSQYLDVVRLLLADPRLKSRHAEFNLGSLIKTASIEMLRLLQKSGTLNLMSYEAYCLRIARRHKRDDVVALLLTDPRAIKYEEERRLHRASRIERGVDK